MSERSSYVPGTFSWIDLSTPNPTDAKAFYTALMGWDAVDMPIDGGGVYTMFRYQGKDVAGMGEMPAAQVTQGVPPNWMSYVSVDNAEAVAAKAADLGGTVIVPAFDVMDSGRMAVIQDPTGAVFSLWQPGNHIGAGLVNEPVSLSWNELATSDSDKAAAFYTALFDWTTDLQEMPQGPYTVFLNQGNMNAGMMQITEDWGDIPPHWMIYFAVEDCDATAAKVTELGGQVSVPPFDIAIGRIAVVNDPQGAHFTIIKLNQTE